MKIDHVSVAGSSLRALEGSFSESGLTTEYGGPHSSGPTEMSLLGFDDGSYIELISAARPGNESSIWQRQIEGNGGPCAWAIEVDDIAGEVSRARQLGIQATDPEAYSRKRPDGVLVEWKLGFIGDQEPGAILPFLIRDTTPRELRVRPSPSVTGGPLRGIGTVVIGVNELDGPIGLFRKMYGWGEPEIRGDLWDGARLASFVGSPVALAAPAGNGWLTQRLEKFGQCPCAFLIEATDLGEAANRYALEPRQNWFGGAALCWVRPLKERGMMIGAIGR